VNKAIMCSCFVATFFHFAYPRFFLQFPLNVVDVGITLEVAATLVPQHLFLPMICAGNMCKAMCGVAAGACNGAINIHWARGSDISDINAKFGAQVRRIRILPILVVIVSHYSSIHFYFPEY